MGSRNGRLARLHSFALIVVVLLVLHGINGDGDDSKLEMKVDAYGEHEQGSTPPVETSAPQPRLMSGHHLRSAAEAVSAQAENGDPLPTHHKDFNTSISRDHGIIISLHNGIIAMGVSLIHDLRCLGNTDLIQVYHCFPGELSRLSRELLLANDLRLEIIDVCTDFIQQGVLKSEVAVKFRSWWIKPLALYHTNVREVILIDADAVPLHDPAILRSLPGYQRTGTIFFYDRVLKHNWFFNADVKGKRGVQYLRNWIETFDYASFGLDGPSPSKHLLESFSYARKSCHEMDSSMVAVDKSRSGKAMDVLWFLITKQRFIYDFSWGDKEAFWLAYEFAHQDYYFSPWGVSVVSSSTNRDMEEHPDTLCGSIAQFLPSEDNPADLLYVNGKALLEPFPLGADTTPSKNVMYNPNPTHVTPRQPRTERHLVSATSFRKWPDECLNGLGSTPLPASFQPLLLQRRLIFMAITSEFYEPLKSCYSF